MTYSSESGTSSFCLLLLIEQELDFTLGFGPAERQHLIEKAVKLLGALAHVRRCSVPIVVAPRAQPKDQNQPPTTFDEKLHPRDKRGAHGDAPM